MYTCAHCSKVACKKGEFGKAPSNCPCTDTEELNKVKELYQDEENQKLAYFSAQVEVEGYCKRTRIEEIMDFANKCDFKRLGVAFCIGLSREANTLCKILQNNGFEVDSVVCKCGSIPKEFLNLLDSEKLKPGTREAMCNPIGQAHFLNKANTDLNIILGLCVGHDSLFIKYCDAPVTVFAAKDRVLAHNPMGALYLADSYYKKKVYKQDK